VELALVITRRLATVNRSRVSIPVTKKFDPYPIGYFKENLKIHTGVPSPPSLALSSPSSPPPAFPSLSLFPPFLYPLLLEVWPLKSS